MDLLTAEIERKIGRDNLDPAVRHELASAERQMPLVLVELYANIPASKRVSYGRVHIVKVLVEYLHARLAAARVPILDVAANLYGAAHDPFARGVALGFLSFCGLDDCRPGLPFFESAAADSDWEIRELAQLFFRVLIQKYPGEMKQFLLRLVDSDNAWLRRFVAETLRPVQENRWFCTQPDYPLTVLRHLFREGAPYPRTSVGNGLSDLARRLPDLVYRLAQASAGLPPRGMLALAETDKSRQNPTSIQVRYCSTGTPVRLPHSAQERSYSHT